MSTMSISLPEALQRFVDEQVAGGSYGSSDEYVRELIRRDQDRERMRGLVLESGAPLPTAPANESYFESLRRHVRGE
jgi:antitoxin ParD1/3/4